MMEMLELSDRFLKSHKNTQRAITNTVETNKNIVTCKEIENISKEIEIFITESTNIKGYKNNMNIYYQKFNNSDDIF